MEYRIHGQEPAAFFAHFEEISAIPRGSGNEKGISDFLVNYAKSLGLEWEQDEVNNVIIRKPASPGCEGAPSVMLQGHMDMVCEKNADVAHDFLTEGIDLVIDGDILRANGTTLGGDNGVAVALMMMILEDKTLVHPALECVFTVSEEVGLEGAKALDGARIHSRMLINMDSGGDGEATVSCAGGLRVDLSKNGEFAPAAGKALAISIRGLAGGHSGVEIHLGHANANKLLGRILYALLEKFDGLRLGNITGGSKDNAIPRESDAIVLLPENADIDRAIARIEAESADIASELYDADANFRVNVSPAECGRAMSEKASRDLIEMVFLAPNGVKVRNPMLDDFVVTSLNLGVIKTVDDTVTVAFAPRSSVGSLQNQTKKELSLLARRFGFTLSMRAEYPGWKYAEQSVLREVFAKVYRTQTGKEMKFSAIHAGLECGLLVDKLPGLDAIAVGAEGGDCHTPNEWLDMRTIAPFFAMIRDVLRELSEK